MSNPIKPTFKTEIIPLLAVVLVLVSSVYFYNNFPERVPIHWNAAGEIDNYGSRATGAFLFPLIIIGMYLIFLGIPYLDPKKDRYNQFRKTYHIFKGCLTFFMAVIYFIASLNALGINIPVAEWVPRLVGILFIVIGNYLSKIKPNWFLGIRTPWTLSSEEVWNKTHRFGGKIFIAGGVILFLMNWLPVGLRMPLLIANILFIILGTAGYSYFVYYKENKKK